MERSGAFCSSGCNNSKSCAVQKPEALRQSVRNLTACHVMCETGGARSTTTGGTAAVGGGRRGSADATARPRSQA